MTRVGCKTLDMQRHWIILGFLLVVGALSAGVWSYGYSQAVGQLAKRGEADLELASGRLSTQLQRFQETAVLLADHPALDHLDTPLGLEAAKSLLLGVADKTSALELMYADRTGTVLVSARGLAPPNLNARSYFRRAMQGALGSGHGIKDPLERRAYYYAAPDFSPDGRVRGALVIAVDIANIEWDWRGSKPAVFFTDTRGEVFISNRSEILFWRRGPGGAGLIPPNGGALPFQAQVLDPHEIWRLDWGPYLPDTALHLVQNLPVIGLRGEALIDVAPARQLAWLQTYAVAAICLAFGAMLFLATERRRTLAEANAVLESRVSERTRALSASNVQLRREVSERQEAEAALKKAQAELVQAGKLSALGQMSAGISHELNQPLMAIQQFADNGTAFLERGKAERAGENLGRISQMATRMARIIKNLRAFARNESEPMGRVDLVQVINTAVELTEPRLKADGVDLIWASPTQAVYAWGGEVRLVQVFVNLLNNAVDAMAGADLREIEIKLTPGARLEVAVCDTGPGIEEPEKIFDPFYSTKAVGSSEGMGLGLSISYGLVQSFGGNIRGSNRARGAMFVVELDYYKEGTAV